MQLFREKNRHIDISIEKSREMDAILDKKVILDPESRYLPLDDCELDFY